MLIDLNFPTKLQMYLPSRGGQAPQNQRLNTGLRAPTGYNQQKMVSTIHHQFLNIGERPVTQQGMLGIKPTTAGPKRKVLSRSYFLVLLKQKISDLTTEIAKFREQKEEFQKEIEVQKNLEIHHSKLSTEVRDLEGSLADYNLAMDKQRSGTRPEDLINIKEHISLQNKKLRNQVDNIFMERKNMEEKIGQLEDRISELKGTADLKLNELSPSEREEYKKCEYEVRELEHDHQNKAQNLEEVSRKIIDQEHSIRMDGVRLKSMQIKEGIIRFENKKIDLEDKLSENSLTFEELRKKLMDKVKVEKSEIQNLEKRVKELRKLNDTTLKRLNKILNEEKGGNEIDDDQKKKFEILYQKENEINHFLESFENLRKKRLSEIELLENGNLKVVDNITKNLNILKKVPDQKDLEQMTKELGFKKQQAENSEETLERVQIEHLRRQEELQRVDEIQETLPERINQFKVLLEEMKKDIGVFENKDKEKEDLIKKTSFLRKRIKEIEVETMRQNSTDNEAEKEFNEQSKKLQTHEQFQAFFDVEKQLSQTAQLEASILNFIQMKESDCDFSKQIDSILKISKEINAVLIAENK